MNKNIAVLWDIQNVLPSKENAAIFVDGLLSYCESVGNRSYLLAVGDWKKTIAGNIPSILSEKGFELLFIPQVDEKGKKTKDSVDFILITKATEMIFQYPHIDCYIILTGDVDFRPLVQLLKKHGKTVIIIYNPDNVSERLLEFADDHKDYRDLIPDETDVYSDENDLFTKDEAFKLLTEAISRMEIEKKVPTPGSVKVKMKMINDSFDGRINKVNSWIGFINEANKKGYIEIEQKKKDLVLSVVNKQRTIPDIFRILLETMSLISKDKRWITFTTINQKMIEEEIHIKDYHYTKFKKLALEAEKRELIEIKNDGVKWSAKIR